MIKQILFREREWLNKKIKKDILATIVINVRVQIKGTSLGYLIVRFEKILKAEKTN